MSKLSANQKMAGQRSTGSPKGIQLGITNFMQRATSVSNSLLSVETGSKNNKRQRNSPESDPRKCLTMESNTSIHQIDDDSDNQTVNLPPELKLPYVSLTKMVEQKMQPIEKIENDMKTLLKDRELLLEYIQKVQNLEHNTDQLTSKVVKIEEENQELKQKLVKIEDKLLENNLIISGVEESKLEEEGPHREKVRHCYCKSITWGNRWRKAWEGKEVGHSVNCSVGQVQSNQGMPNFCSFC